MTTYKPENREYVVEDYSPVWVEKFKAIQEVVQSVFGDKALQFEHVGSTSIVGMRSKPIIDVLILVKDVQDLKIEVEKMEKFGYEYKEDYLSPDSIFFCKEINGVRFENIHVFPVGHNRVAEFLDTRDYLRSHPEETKRYSDIKSDLAKRFPHDYIAYRNAKDEYLNVELRKKVEDWKSA